MLHSGPDLDEVRDDIMIIKANVDKSTQKKLGMINDIMIINANVDKFTQKTLGMINYE